MGVNKNIFEIEENRKISILIELSKSSLKLK